MTLGDIIDRYLLKKAKPPVLGDSQITISCGFKEKVYGKTKPIGLARKRWKK